MICPVCHEHSKVIESRPVNSGAGTRRRRECDRCDHRFTTFERYGDAPAPVRKRDGGREPFDATKLRAGLERSAHKRPRAEAALDAIVSGVAEEARGSEEISSRRIGELCLEGLRDADRVAYLRFASVHKQLADLEALSAELDDLAISEEFETGMPGGEAVDSPQLETQPDGREIHA